MYANIVRLIYKIETNNVVSSIKKGFVLLIPVILTGCFALLIRNFPVPAFQEFLQQALGGLLDRILLMIYDSTIGLMSVYLVFSISHCYAQTTEQASSPNPIMAGVVSFACFAASFGAASGSMTMTHLGPVGVFTALFAAVAGTRLFNLFSSLLSVRLRKRTAGTDSGYRDSISLLFPMVLCILVFVGLNLLIQALFQVSNFNDLISGLIVSLFNNLQNDFLVGLLFVVVLNFLWMFGIHGGNVLEQVSQTYLVPADTLPDVIVSKTFLDNFALMGGSGAAICLLLALLLFARGKSSRRLVRSAAPAVLFNINEILVYGLPVVFNPVMLIPFILTPVCSLAIAYGATAIGFMPVVTQSVSWTTPVFASGYLASGSVSGIVVQAVVLAVGTAIYAPFVRISERVQQNQAELLLGELTGVFRKAQQNGEPAKLLSRGGSIGVLAKNMAARLRLDLQQDGPQVWYQPQFNQNGRFAGAEALLRWQYMGQMVYPPLAVALAQEDGCFDQLTQCVLRAACRDCRALRDTGQRDYHIAANTIAEQCNDPRFVQDVIDLVDEYGIAGYFCLEVTEETTLEEMHRIPEHIHRLRENGIEMAVDDFSMGHTSFKYLQNNGFGYVKLDGALVRQVAENPRSREIISSIIALGTSLDFTVIAEYVENEEIRAELGKLGCGCYQGYLFSPAVPFEELCSLVEQNRVSYESQME